MADKVRVRIAPSPTGFAHVGTAYTALFNFAFARSVGGKFILRLEDTDAKRNIAGVEEALYEGLSWLGIDWDEGPDKGGKYFPYRQSEKLSFYQEKAKELVKKSFAYEDAGSIRFKNRGEDVKWNDLVHGEITFPGGQITDFVILKSDGYPTYNFGVVLDDIYMKISHVIRGEEHISNTPRQLALYKVLGVQPPLFAHHVTLRGADRKKLSKRRDPVNLSIYKDQGYLPQALVNFLCNMGWSHPEGKEIFNLQEFVKLFDVKRLRKAGPIFDITKLDWVNGEYIRSLTTGQLTDQVFSFFKGRYSREKITEITPLIKDRIKKLSEFETLAGFFFEEPKENMNLFGQKSKEHLVSARKSLEKVSSWNKEKIDSALLTVIKEKDYKTGDFFMDLRVAITGSKFTPPINESIVILGKEKTLKRLQI